MKKRWGCGRPNCKSWSYVDDAESAWAIRSKGVREAASFLSRGRCPSEIRSSSETRNRRGKNESAEFITALSSVIALSSPE